MATLVFNHEEIAARELKPELLELDGISRASVEAHYKLYEGYVNKRNEILGKLGEVDLAGANQVYGPSLTVSDAEAQYGAAVDAAFDDARARAEAIAAKAGVTLGAPVAIVETGGGGGVVPYYGRAVAEAAAADVAVEPGTQDVGATLTVTFAIS